MYERINKETDLKFKKIVLMENQLNMLKQEQDVMRSKKTKEDTKQNEDKT